MTAAAFDPYALRAEEIEEPPLTVRKAITRLGPGMVLAASIVGSGELMRRRRWERRSATRPCGSSC